MFILCIYIVVVFIKKGEWVKEELIRFFFVVNGGCVLVGVFVMNRLVELLTYV